VDETVAISGQGVISWQISAGDQSIGIGAGTFQQMSPMMELYAHIVGMTRIMTSREDRLSDEQKNEIETACRLMFERCRGQSSPPQ
jgi:hypothetical protein